MVYQTTGAEDETIQFTVFVQLLDTVKNTGNHIVTTGSLTAGEDNAHIHSGEVSSLIGSFELNQRHSVSVREQFFDIFLIGNRLSSRTGHCFYSTFQPFRKFGLIGSPCNLQCTFSHFSSIFKGVNKVSFKSVANFALFRKKCKPKREIIKSER